MHLIVFAYNFPPVGGGFSYRMATYCRHWAEMGHKITVLSAAGDAMADTIDYELAAELEKLMNIIRIPSFWNSPIYRQLSKYGLGSFSRKAMRLIMWPDTCRGWAVRASNHLEHLLRGENRNNTVVITSSAPYSSHLIGRVAKGLGVTWCADFRDHYTLNPFYSPVTPIHSMKDRSFERFILENADLAVINTQWNLREIKKAFAPLDGNLIVIHNGFDSTRGRAMQIKRGDRLNMLYLGGIRGSDFETPLLEMLLRTVNSDPEMSQIVKLKHFGNGYLQGKAADRLRSIGVLEDGGFVPADRVPEILKDSHLGVVIVPAKENCSGWVPQKLYSYLGAGRPVFLMAPEGEAAEIIRSIGGAVIDVLDPEKGIETLKSWIDMWRKNQWHFDPETISQRAILFDNSVLAQQWMYYLENLVL